MQINNPEFLLFFIFVPFVLFVFKKNFKRFYIYYPFQNYLKNNNKKYLFFRIFLNFLIIFFIILGLANFQKINKIITSHKKGINIMMVLDTSGSMRAIDFKYKKREITRLSALKIVLKEFIKNRPNDKIGLIVFGKDAFTQCPLTIDHTTLNLFVKNLQIGMAGDSTAIGSALILALKRLKNIKSKSKIIILVTDGRNNAGLVNPITVAKLAAQEKIKIYTIGIGTKGKLVPIIQQTIFGPKKILVDVELDDFTLRQIAKITGGKYFNAQSFKELQNIYLEINKLEKVKLKVKYFKDVKFLYNYFVLFALCLIFLKIIIFNGFRQIYP